MKEDQEPFVSRLWRAYASMQFARFLLIGGVAAGLHWGSRFFFSMAFDFTIAVILAYFVGLASAYVLNRLYVFPNSSRPIRQEIIYFVAINFVAFPLVLGLSLLLGEHIFTKIFPPELARASGHAIAVGSPVLVNFAAHKFLTFRER